MTVWEGCHPTVRAVVIIGVGEPVVRVADHTVDTIHERDAVTWAVELIFNDVQGTHVMFV